MQGQREAKPVVIPLENILVVLASFVLTLSLLAYFRPGAREEIAQTQPLTRPSQPLQPPTPPQPEPPRPPEISNSFPGYQNYDGVVAQLKEWEKEAPDFVEIGIYGKSSRGKELWYIRVTNEKSGTGYYSDKLRTLVTASIHGNEPLSTSTTMGYIGTMLDTYGKDSEATQLVDTRELFFIPVVSPDSYPRSRHVDGVDPNRNFPTARDPNRRSVPPVQALRDFFLKVKPHAVISGHTYGRVYLHPWGDSTSLSPNHQDFQRVIGEMGRLSRYRVIRACQMYNRPIFGTEVDWYYRNGAISVVMEFGTHQRVPSMQDTRAEFDRTYKAVLYFLKDAPEVQVSPSWRFNHPYLRTLFRHAA